MISRVHQSLPWLFAARLAAAIALLCVLGPLGALSGSAARAQTPERPPEPNTASEHVLPGAEGSLPWERQDTTATDTAAMPEGPEAAPESTTDDARAAVPAEQDPKQHEVAERPAESLSEGGMPVPPRNPIRTGTPVETLLNPKRVAALEQCAVLLDGIELDYVQLESNKKRVCGAHAPIKLSSIGKNPAVAVSPPATVNCLMAAKLHTWLKTSVQPTAEALGAKVVRIKNAASYKCRNQYGGANTKLSEHALANALDISAFTLASGQTIKVLGNWPYGYRPTRPQIAGLPLPNPLRDHTSLPPDENGTPGVKVHMRPPSKEAYDEELQELTRVATNPFFKPMFGPPIELGDLEDEEPEGPLPAGSLSREEAKSFLRTIHADACKTFWTVLGPEANRAHRDHFHFDMRKRRYVTICQ